MQCTKSRSEQERTGGCLYVEFSKFALGGMCGGWYHSLSVARVLGAELFFFLASNSETRLAT